MLTHWLVQNVQLLLLELRSFLLPLIVHPSSQREAPKMALTSHVAYNEIDLWCHVSTAVHFWFNFSQGTRGIIPASSADVGGISSSGSFPVALFAGLHHHAHIRGGSLELQSRQPNLRGIDRI